jgi:iron(II)-dependent oxidoreductase
MLVADFRVSSAALVEMLQDARTTTLGLVADLTTRQLLGPRLPIVNPPLWEIGHVAWFQEKWALRHLRGQPPVRPDADALYDSAAVAHDTRWDLPLPSRQETLALMQEILDRVVGRLDAAALDTDAVYFHLLALFHEDMHTEALGYTRQTHGYAPSPRPAPSAAAALPVAGGGSLPGDVEIPGGRFLLGASPDDGFVFDNEKWAHPVELAPFRIARAAVTNAEFAAFVEAGGYSQPRWWSEAGWRWRQGARAEHPVYWQRATEPPMAPGCVAASTPWFRSSRRCRCST